MRSYLVLVVAPGVSTPGAAGLIGIIAQGVYAPWAWAGSGQEQEDKIKQHGSFTAVQVLPKYKHASYELCATYISRKYLSPKVRTFIDFLTEALGD